MEQNRRTTTFLAIVVVAIGYYALLASKQWTWMFVSGDSGDWLASSTIWMTPQPFGSPLYVLLGHFINILPGDNLVWGMTALLSILPAAITVGLVYLIVRQLGYGQKLAILGSGVLLACGIFLSQATVLEEYALASMFVTGAFYFYLRDNKKLTALCLGLGTAVHIIVIAIALLWFAVNWTEWRKWWKQVGGIYILVGIVPYSLILVLMAMDTPRLIAGGLSLGSINAYLGTTGTIGKISLVETPGRIADLIVIVLLGLGVSVVPLVHGLKRPWTKVTLTMIVTLAFCLWLYLTNTDSTTWTFLCFALPIGAVAVAIGLSKMPRWCLTATVFCVIALIITNGVMLNADRLTRQDPKATEYYQAVMELPDSASVVLPKGGPYGLGLMYAMADGKEVTPVFLQHEEGWDNPAYRDYIVWAESKEGIEGENWIEQVSYCLEQGKETFVIYSILAPEWQERINDRYKLQRYNYSFWRIVSEK